ncbi:MAG: hypothetical protein CR986_07950 [Ignavibacteriae bacterium]|nr:MAG: hypothetical protein CR986_07950 [Ignavibacteriota bacterium]
MKIKILLIYLLLFLTVNYAGIITLKKDGKKAQINSIEIRGLQFVSSRELSKYIADNYYFNSEKEKSEIKFVDYKLKFTANNQFVILTDKKSNKHQIFQMPISAVLKDDDIYVPIKFVIKYLSYAATSKITLQEDEVIIHSQNIDTKKEVTWNKNILDRNSITYDIFSAKIENKANGTLLRLGTKRKVIKPTSSITNNTLYVFFTDLSIDKNIISELKSKGFIKKIKVKHINGNPQMEIKLRSGFDKHEISYDEDIGEILISIHNKSLRGESSLDDEIDKWNFDVIVLDAGHGGKDPGAIGLGGVKEKDINLAIVKELGKLLEKSNKNLKVVYTREGNSFLELYKRGKIANEKKGNLFISVHCNSTQKKPTNARGFEVYLLRPGKTKNAINIAEFENSVISMEDNPSRYKQLNDENFILVSMAHSSYMRYSETFADMLNTEWIKSVEIPSRGIKQAGFYVLVGASMPGVLIESGFLSNKKDVKYLNSKKGQKEIAEAIYNSIIKYRNYYESSINTELHTEG